MVAIEYLAKGDAEHLAALIEDGLHDTAEELFVAAKVGHVITRHPNDGTLHLWRRIEDTWLNGEEILHVIPSLNQHREDAILLIARL